MMVSEVDDPSANLLTLDSPPDREEPAFIPWTPPQPLPSRRTRRGSRPWMVAAVLVVIAGLSAGGAYLARGDQRPLTTEPAQVASVPIGQQIVGLWKGRESAFPHSLIFRSDGTVSPAVQSEDLLNPVVGHSGHYVVTGDTLTVSGAAVGSRCDHTYAVETLAQGWIRLSQLSPGSGGCGGELAPAPFTLVRLSPSSQAGVAYPPASASEIAPVQTTNPLHGTWLLQHSGVVLVVAQTGPLRDVDYRLDARGTIDSAAQDQGRLTVTEPGRILLRSNATRSCGDSVLRGVAASDYAFTSRVEADPCDWFAGQTLLTWLLVE